MVAEESRSWSALEIIDKITRNIWLAISPDEAVKYCNEYGTPTQELVQLLNINVGSDKNTELTSSQIEANLKRKRDEIFRSMW